jgi:hypothetical protein
LFEISGSQLSQGHPEHSSIKIHGIFSSKSQGKATKIRKIEK